MATDIIISAFATPSESGLRKAGLKGWTPEMVHPLNSFKSKPKVISVPKSGKGGQPPPAWGGKGFHNTADKMAAKGNGSILSGVLQTYAAGITPRRICLVGFSAGNSFLTRVLASPQDAEKIDTLISLDGMTYPKVNGKPYDPAFMPWINFAKRATGMNRMARGVSNPYLGPLFVQAHTHIVSNSSQASSTDEASKHLFWKVNDDYWKVAKKIPKSVSDDQGARQKQIISRLNRALDSVTPVTVDCGNPRIKKTYTSLKPKLGYLGNFWGLDFGGTQGPDHCMICYVAQAAIMDAYLVPRWNSRNEAVAGLSGLAGGVGATESEGDVDWTSPGTMQPGGGIVQPGAIDTGINYMKTAALLGALGAGSWALGKYLSGN